MINSVFGFRSNAKRALTKIIITSIASVTMTTIIAFICVMVILFIY